MTSKRSSGGSIFDKLTDSSLYTGTHKHRFDEFGNGKGLNGRDRVAKGSGYVTGAPGGAVADLSQITRTNLNASGAGYAHTGNSYGGTLDIPYVAAQPARGTTPTSPSLYSTGRASGDGAYPKRDIYNFPTAGPRNPATMSVRPSSVGRNPMTRSSDSGSYTTSGRSSDTRKSGGSIFDKLTDSSQYTGAHKHRFDQAGYGRGKEGRTSANAYVTPYDLTTRR